MAETCVRCKVSGNEVRLFSAIYDGRIESICERCSVIENVPIIKSPNINQLRELEGSRVVYDRMKKLKGIRDERRDETFFQEDRLKELEKNPELEKPQKDSLNLIDFFHWEIMKNRRRKGLSQKQLASAIVESEVAVQMIEKGKLPEGAERIIRKLEQFFLIRLRKMSDAERIMKEKQKRERIVLIGADGKELDSIPEPEIISENKDAEEDFDLNKNSINKNRVESGIEDFNNKRKIILEPVSNVPKNYPKEFKKIPINDEKTFNGPALPGDSRVFNRPTSSGDDKKQEIFDAEQKQTAGGFGDIKKADFNLRKADLSRVTINDLKELHRKKIEASRQEKIEEQRKIEERQRILEAFREKERIKNEQKKKEDEMMKRKLEDERQRLVEERKKELSLIKEKESKDIDRFLGGSELLSGKRENNNYNELDE